MSRVRVYLGCSLDGYIAGDDDDLSWLHVPPREGAPADSGSLDFATFMGEIGALLMGRRTYDVVTGFDGDWPYGQTPVLVATHRPLEAVVPSVRAVSGDIADLVAEARRVAGARDVYLDGGDLVRRALAADLVDAMTLTFLPLLLGRGVQLFGDLDAPLDVRFTAHHWFGDGGAVQITLDRAR